MYLDGFGKFLKSFVQQSFLNLVQKKKKKKDIGAKNHVLAIFFLKYTF